MATYYCLSIVPLAVRSVIKRRFLAILATGLCLLASCTRGLSPEEKKQIETLRAELEEVQKEVALAKGEELRYEGGLLKSLIRVRIEVIKTTEALIQQRIKAIESKSPVSIQTQASKPDTTRADLLAAEIKIQEAKLREAEIEANKYSGGLIHALALTTTATQAQTLAMLRQQYLVAKLGLAIPTVTADTSPRPEIIGPTSPDSAKKQPRDKKLEDEVILVSLVRKEFTKQDYQDFIFFRLDYTASGLDKPARAIKGVLNLSDLFGESKFKLRWTIDKPIKPGEVISERGTGFKFNQFTDSHQWVRATQIADMKVTFTVTNILYQDGTRRDFE